MIESSSKTYLQDGTLVEERLNLINPEKLNNNPIVEIKNAIDRLNSIIEKMDEEKCCTSCTC